jgi:hypothetical protein
VCDVDGVGTERHRITVAGFLVIAQIILINLYIFFGNINKVFIFVVQTKT